MARIKKIVTSEVEGRNYSDSYDRNTLAIISDGTLVHHDGISDGKPLIKPGVVYGANHDSGDGFGLNTLKLIPHAPDGNIYDDRYLVIDPTTPNHIHIRAGGQIDDSTAQLILGGENNYVSVSDQSQNVAIGTSASQTILTYANNAIFNPCGDPCTTGAYLYTTATVAAEPGWNVVIDGTSYEVASVTLIPEEPAQWPAHTSIHVPGVDFLAYASYAFISPGLPNNWVFTSGGDLHASQDMSIVVTPAPGTLTLSAYSGVTVQYSQTEPNNGLYVLDRNNPENKVATIGDLPTGATGSFTSADNKTITVTNGIITAITPL